MVYGNMTVFQKALLDTVLAEYQDVPEEAALEDTVSPQFEQWAGEFIKKQNANKSRVYRVIRIALIAAVLIILLAGAAMAVPAIRESVIGYSFVPRQEAFGITFDPEQAATAPRRIETVYQLSWIPEGFELERDEATIALVSRWWISDGGLRILYNQRPIPEDPTNSDWIGLDNTGTHLEKVLIGDYLVDVLRGEESYILMWTNNAYFFTLMLPNEIDHDTMVQIFESLEVRP